jgi:hypothetical protein
VNDELERIWKASIMALFMVISRHLPGGTEENYVKPSLSVAGLRAEMMCI